MARTQANVYLTIWTDPDFRGVSTDAQWLYFTMLTHESLNYCGVMDWRPARLAAMNDDMTIERVEHAAWELGQQHMIAVDPDTEEALVRSFVRHDGVLKQPNPTKGMVREFGGIASLKLMELVAREVRRAFDENPDWRGRVYAEPVLKQFMEPFKEGFIWVPEGFRLPSVSVPEGFDLGSNFDTPKNTEGFRLPSDTSTSTSTSTYVERGAASVEAATPPEKKTVKTGTRIKPDWMPNPEVINTVREEYPDYDLQHEHQNFVDYWLARPGQKALKLDWDATWRIWMRKNAREAAEKKTGGYRNQSQILADNQVKAQARDQARQTQAVIGSARALLEGATK